MRLATYVVSSGKVLSGPFQGLQIPRKEAHIAKLLGTYEIELHGIFQKVIFERFDRFIDIGAAHGFYAVGIARLSPSCKVLAYEADESLHPSISELAKLNGVASQISIRGYCDTQSLEEIKGEIEGSFILVDIEGGEKILLNPEKIPQLRKATILVEVHDYLVPGCTETVRERFAPTHKISEFHSRDRTMEEFPFPSFLTKLKLMRPALIDGMSDGRGAPNGWLFLEPKQA